MADTERYIQGAARTRAVKKRLAVCLPVLSLLLVFGVFWWLKLVGITLAGEAFCGIEEHTHGEKCVEKTLICTDVDTAHTHTDACYEIKTVCGKEEHTHAASCYSDITADLETAEVWEETFAGISAELSVPERVTAVAKSQLGYTESTKNFEVDASGERHGYTRYGEWYGNPYGEWSATFAAFCVRYAGLSDAPVSAGAEAMRLQWKDEELYQPAAAYTPLAGDLIFLDKNGNGTADAVGIVTDCADGTVSAIEGDVSDRVAETEYAVGSESICGYGLIAPQNSVLLTGTLAASASTAIAQTVTYSADLLKSEDYFLIYTRASNGNYYAIDGSASAVRVYIDSSGNVTADVSDANTLLWTFTYQGTYQNSDNSYGTQSSYYIQNVATSKYLHPCESTAVLSGSWDSGIFPNGSGVRIRGARQNYYAQLQNNSSFVTTNRESSATTFYFAKAAASSRTVWLDGTNGGLMSLGGSLDKSYTVEAGSTIKLPTEWQSPTKYSYVLKGWYDVKNSRYYAPGAELSVTENLVLYADWAAATYDVGQYNAWVTDTISTSDFITTKVFDYNTLFNVQSESVTVSANASGHSETWSLVTSGKVAYQNKETLDFIFSDYDSTGDISYPSNKDSGNVNGDIYTGLYSAELHELLFSSENAYDPATGAGVIGKSYIGTADHLFQINNDPTSDDYGYYYYDSRLNAASYNQTDKRFYVYDYLERTSDSEKDGGVGAYSDFLPFNSPYVNTNGHTVKTYTYDGENGEYVGVTHHQYDAKYNGSGSSTENVNTNYGFGMSVEVDFYLSDVPGEKDYKGEYGNHDLYGKEMHFRFSGDDDVWVLIDGELVLDIGGIHGVESGDINFSTGEIFVNGEKTSTLSGVAKGSHILTVLYLERGSSQSNCMIYFNLAPRFSLDIQKEDVLSRELLNGAEFSVYMDKDATVPAQLWESKAAHDNGEASTNTFTVKDGKTTMWGLAAGETYYIRETKPPDAEGYDRARGIICLSLDKDGIALDSVSILDETDAEASSGFTAYGFKVDREKQQVYLVITNAQEWVQETTPVQVFKEWKDSKDHAQDTVTVYLTTTAADGTVTRIREAELNAENDWKYVWTGLPKYAQDGTTAIVYGVEEAYLSGYSPTVEKVDKITISTSTWTQSLTFQNGKTYILGTSNGYLSTTSATATTLCWVDAETAKTSPLALWTATVSGSSVRLTNGSGQILSFNNSNSSSSRYFYATTSGTSYQNMTSVQSGTGVRLYYRSSRSSYYIGSIGTNGRATATTSSGSALTFVPMALTTTTTEEEVEGTAFKVTNTPLDRETSVKVLKQWDTGMATTADYEKLQVTVALLANGKDTGRTVTLTLKNGWTDTFLGLPYTDADGNVIAYTVVESTAVDGWVPAYGDVKQVDGTTPTYEVTITNTYRQGQGFELPSTGGFGKTVWILSGFTIMVGSLVCGCIWRRKRERWGKG